jgi:diaminopimelate decarboxylase
VVAGGTHQLPGGRERPFRVVPVEGWDEPGPRPEVAGAQVTVVGQLGTPGDVLARRVKVDRLRAGDILVFELAGAYTWNAAHRDFLLHPAPEFHYLG